MFGEVLREAMSTKENPGDYMKDGILHCGRCNTPKQVLMSLPVLTGTDKPQPLPVACKCQQEADKKAEAEQRAVEFKNGLETRWRLDGFHDTSYLRSTFADDDGTNPKLTTVCKKYVDNWPQMYQNGMGLLFYGNVGSGKTFLAGCVCNALLEQQVRICATSFPRVLNVLQTSMDKQKSLDRLAQYQCVLLDDFGTERSTEYGQEMLFSVIDARYRTKRPTIITTNLSLHDLENPQNLSYSRIFDRLLELCPVRLCVSGPSRRQGLADERRALARELLL